MQMYRIKAVGYGGSGASLTPFTTNDLALVKSEIEDLLLSDHSVELYTVASDGVETLVLYETSHSIQVHIELTA